MFGPFPSDATFMSKREIYLQQQLLPLLQIRTLTEKLQSITEASSEESKELQSRLASLRGKNEELEANLETLLQEKQQLGADLESRVEMVCVGSSKSSKMLPVMSLTSALLHFQISALQEKLKEPQDSDGGQREAELQQVRLSPSKLC